MKITVASHSISDFYFTPQRHSALGAKGVSDILGELGNAVTEFNFPLYGKGKSMIPLPDDLAYLKPLILPREFGALSFFTRYYRLGPTPGKCADIILEDPPELLFISCFAYAYSEDALDLARAVRDKNPAIPIVCGGGGPSALPSRFMEGNIVDYVLTGEFESYKAILHDFIDTIHSGSPYSGNCQSGNNIKGVRVISAREPLAKRRSPGQMNSGHNRETVPDFHAPLRVMKSFRRITRVSLSITRGCPRTCAFCSNFLTQGRKFRKADIGNLHSQLEELEIPAGTQPHFAFEDDNFLLDRNFLFSVLDLIRERYPEVRFSAENGIDYLLLDRGSVSMLIDSGFTRFNLSAGSLSGNLLTQQKRSYNFQHLGNILKYIREAGGSSILYMICGLAGDTPESIVGALLQWLDLPAEIGISPFYSVPGLPGYADPDLFTDLSPTLCKGSSLYPWSGSLTTLEMMTAFRLARFINLLKNPDNDRELLDTCLASGRLFTRIKLRRGEHRIIPVQSYDSEMAGLFFDSLPLQEAN